MDPHQAFAASCLSVGGVRATQQEKQRLVVVVDLFQPPALTDELFTTCQNKICMTTRAVTNPKYGEQANISLLVLN